MPSAKREQFKAPEVCEMARLQPYVLRSWESEFPGLGQTVAGGAGRVYRRQDVELVLRIKQLVFGEGLTLAGARRRLEEEHEGPSVAALAVDDVLDDMARSRLQQVRRGLEEILQLLARDRGRERALELTLVAAKPAGKAAGGKRRNAS